MVDNFLFGLAVPWFTSENYFPHLWEAVTVPAFPWPEGRHEKLLRSIRPTFPVIWNLSKVITRSPLSSFIIHSPVSRWPWGGILCLRPLILCCFLPMELPVPACSVLVAEPWSHATEKSVHFFLVDISQGPIAYHPRSPHSCHTEPVLLSVPQVTLCFRMLPQSCARSHWSLSSTLILQ